MTSVTRATDVLRDVADKLLNLATELEKEDQPKTAFWVVEDSRSYSTSSAKTVPLLDYWGPYETREEAEDWSGNDRAIVEVPIR